MPAWSSMCAVVTVIVLRDSEGAAARPSDLVTITLGMLLPLAWLDLVMFILVVLGALLLVVPGILLSLRWMVAAPVRVVEGGTLRCALQRSAVLTAGSRWRLLLILVVESVAPLSIHYGLGMLPADIWPDEGSGARMMVSAGLTFLNVLVGAIPLTLIAAVCYLQLRRLHEAGTLPS